MNVFSLYGDVDVRTENASSTLSTLQTKAKKVSEAFKNIGQKVKAAGSAMTRFATVPIAAALGYSINQASDLNETLGKTKVVFKESSDAVIKWSKDTLSGFGLAQGTALDMASIYGDMGTAMGLSTKKASGMSMSMVELAGDMASFKNMKPDQIHTALTGIFTGETEALKSLGVVMTETNLIEYAKSQGIKKSIKDMTQAEKVQLRYAFVMDQSKNSIGDFKRTQESAANQMRIFTESLKEVGAQIGTILLPTFTKVVTVLNEWVKKFRLLPTSIQSIVVKIALFIGVVGPLLLVLGTVITVIGTIIGFLSSLSITVIAVGAGIIGLGAIIAAIIVKTVGWQTILQTINNVVTSFIDLIQRMWTAMQEGRDPLFAAVEWFQGLGLVSDEVSAKIGVLYLRFKDFVENLKQLLQNLWEKFQEAWDGIWEVVGPFFAKLREEALPIFVDVISEILSLLSELAKDFGENLDLIWALWKKIWKKIKPYVEENLNNAVTIIKGALDIIKNVIKGARAFITGDWSGLWRAVKNILKAAVNTSTSLSKSLLKQVVNVIISLRRKVIAKIKSMISSAIKTAKSGVRGMYRAGKNLMDMFLQGVKSKIQSIKNAVSGAANTVKNFLGFSSPTKEGPGRTADKWAPNLMKMYRQGILSRIPAIKKAVSRVGSVISDGINSNNIDAKINMVMDNVSNKNSGGEAKKIELIVNNPKFFDVNDINKFMNPVVARLKSMGYKGV